MHDTTHDDDDATRDITTRAIIQSGYINAVFFFYENGAYRM